MAHYSVLNDCKYDLSEGRDLKTKFAYLKKTAKKSLLEVPDVWR